MADKREKNLLIPESKVQNIQIYHSVKRKTKKHRKREKIQKKENQSICYHKSQKTGLDENLGKNFEKTETQIKKIFQPKKQNFGQIL